MTETPPTRTPKTPLRSPLLLILGIVIIIAAAAAVFFFAGGRKALEEAGVIKAKNPEVGQCIDSGSDRNVVDCGSAEARYKVVSLTDITDDVKSACKAVPEATGVILTTNNTGKALCVTDLRRPAPKASADASSQPTAPSALSVGDCVSQSGGSPSKVECSQPGARPILADVADRGQDACREIPGATGAIRVFGATSSTFCLGAAAG